ncbi:hypothetical protein FA13DRAFT_1729580 [Coprinellus micaceus]|uniref:Uncharacterized protein n=1 Tax=Coprinellus micaceus TaxID=71717 RepID=A0A4Y7TIU9_COPMI|nr:hypothetical protein FA13DRAFT_1729580 [Coprinellus micaceus]
MGVAPMACISLGRLFLLRTPFIVGPDQYTSPQLAFFSYHTYVLGSEGCRYKNAQTPSPSPVLELLVDSWSDNPHSSRGASPSVYIQGFLCRIRHLDGTCAFPVSAAGVNDAP